jgi:hypothetical protein
VTRSKAFSALVPMGLLVGLTVAQAPQPPTPKTGGSGKAADPNQIDPMADALRSHPDIRLAEAKLRVAEAELAQAKLLVAQRIAIAEAKVQEYKARVDYTTKIYGRLQGTTGISVMEKLAAEKDFAATKAALIGAEAELTAARGASASDSRSAEERAIERGIHFLKSQQGFTSDSSMHFLAAMMEINSKQVPAGSATDKLRELLDKRVKVGVKRQQFNDAMPEFVKQAGLEGVTIRAPDWANAATLKNPPTVGPLEGEQTVAGWLQLILDDFNQTLAAVPSDRFGKYDIYVREYGLLMTKVDLAPPGAVTLNEFVRQLRAAKAIEKTEKK